MKKLFILVLIVILSSFSFAKVGLKGGVQGTCFNIGDRFPFITGVSGGFELSINRVGFEFGIENDNKWLLKGIGIQSFLTYLFNPGKKIYYKGGIGFIIGKPDFRYNYYNKEEENGVLRSQKWIYPVYSSIINDYKVAVYPALLGIAGTKLWGPFYAELSLKIRVMRYEKKSSEFNETEELTDSKESKFLKFIPTLNASIALRF